MIEQKYLFAASMGLLLAFSPDVGVRAGEGAPGSSGSLASHRAVYEIILERADKSSGISALKGRMVYEFKGSGCAGYSQSMRLVTRMTDHEGRPSLSDIRSSSWEGARGERFRFNAKTYRDRELSEETAGDAKRPPSSGILSVRLTKPEADTLELPGELVFPIQHTIAILEAAKAGRRWLRIGTYDGSEQGRKFYDTTTFVGCQYPLGQTHEPALAPATGAERLEGLASWPVAISYYNPGSRDGDGLPTYEMTFRFYRNGVTRRLLMDYGDFAIRGTLKSIEFLDPADCAAQENGEPN